MITKLTIYKCIETTFLGQGVDGEKQGSEKETYLKDSICPSQHLTIKDRTRKIRFNLFIYIHLKLLSVSLLCADCRGGASSPAVPQLQNTLKEDAAAREIEP